MKFSKVSSEEKSKELDKILTFIQTHKLDWLDKLLAFGHRSLIKSVTPTAVINIF